MTLNEYQEHAKRTHNGTLGNMLLTVMALGLAGESGEVADLVKKVVGHGHDLDKGKLLKELGDVLWYVAMTAECLGADLETVARLNVDKLRARYPEGFTVEASKHG